MEVDEAIAITIDLLQKGEAGKYGHDLFAQHVAATAALRLHGQFNEESVRNLSPLFYDAAWELCRRGIVRPGVRTSGDQAIADGGGYSLTEAGRAALPKLDSAALLIAQPGALAATLAGFSSRFGAGFQQRALEAINCRNAQTLLACCAMVGAAAESILLALAIAKIGDELKVLQTYSQSRGRAKILDMVVGRVDQHRRNQLTTFASIVGLWRDEAAHGKASPLSTANADEALRELLHMCQWVDREWVNLTV
jgi:hypothetical protein